MKKEEISVSEKRIGDFLGGAAKQKQTDELHQQLRLSQKVTLGV